MPQATGAKFLEVFAAVKGCSVVNTAIVTCRNLIPHKKYIKDSADLKDKFIMKSAGLTISPVEGLALNFKQLYTSDLLNTADRKFILLVLHKMWVISHDVYDAVSSPDIDVNEFVTVIMSSIGEVRRHIPRCDQAFDKIIESVDLLKGNFGGYYRDYVATSNPTIIMENFVLDVSKNTKSSPQVTAQFRKIISHYRKLASQHASHPKLQTLFQQVDRNFQELEKQDRATDELPASEDSDSDAVDSDADPDEARHEAEEVAKIERVAGIVHPGRTEIAVAAQGAPSHSAAADGKKSAAQVARTKKKRLRRQLKLKNAKASAQATNAAAPGTVDESPRAKSAAPEELAPVVLGLAKGDSLAESLDAEVPPETGGAHTFTGQQAGGSDETNLASSLGPEPVKGESAIARQIGEMLSSGSLFGAPEMEGAQADLDDADSDSKEPEDEEAIE